MVVVNILMLIVSLYVLVKSSDYFIESASHIAKKLGVSDFLIGVTLVAVGTSIPELSSAIIASINGYGDLVLGSVIGSNIANIGLVVAVCAIIVPLSCDESILKRDGYILLFISLIFVVLIFDGKINIFEGLILLILYFSYVMFLLTMKRDQTSQYHFKAYFNYLFKFQYLVTIHDAAIRGFVSNMKKGKLTPVRKMKAFWQFREGLLLDFLMICLTAALIVLAAKFFVTNAAAIADMLHTTRNSIGLTIVAIGTSLPELTVSISAARKRLGNILIGNIIGSNIANIGLIIGISSIITTVGTTVWNYYFIGIALIFMTLLLLVFIKNDWTIKKREGVIALALYGIFVVMTFWLK